MPAAGITYRQLDYWARTGLVEPSVRAAHGSGSQRLYGFRDILVLKVVKRLLDTGISLQQIRAAVQHLRDHGTEDLAQVTLMSDGVSVYECTSPDEVVDLLAGGQGVFGIALGRVWQEVAGELAELPAVRAEDGLIADGADELAPHGRPQDRVTPPRMGLTCSRRRHSRRSSESPGGDLRSDAAGRRRRVSDSCPALSGLEPDGRTDLWRRAAERVRASAGCAKLLARTGYPPGRDPRLTRGGRRRGNTSPEPLRHQGPAGTGALEPARRQTGSPTGEAPVQSDFARRLMSTARPSPPGTSGRRGRPAGHARHPRLRVARRPADRRAARLRAAARRRSARLPPPRTEPEVLAELRRLAARNTVLTPMIGLGYYGTVTPAVIRRNVLENPAWYTAYTPYQPEISQGRLEALLNFQTMVCDLTGLDVANASLLDEATAAAEAMTLRPPRSRRGATRSSSTPTACRRPSTCCAPGPSRSASSCRGRAGHRGRRLRRRVRRAAAVPGRLRARSATSPPSSRRRTRPARWSRSPPTCSRSPCSRRPGELGADIARRVHPAFRRAAGLRRPARRGTSRCATRSSGSCPAAWSACRSTPTGSPAYRLALQTREQHIRREKATSNICTAQVLLAVIAAMYAVYHGPDGLTAIAAAGAPHAPTLAAALRADGVDGSATRRSSTPSAPVPGPGRGAAALPRAREAGINLRRADAGRSRSPATRRPRRTQLRGVVRRLLARPGGHRPGRGRRAAATDGDAIPAPLAPDLGVPHPPGLPPHHTETAMLRYLRRLSDTRHRPRPGDDPARLVHHEAERDHRDGAGHLAGVRRDPPVRARSSRPPATPS